MPKISTDEVLKREQFVLDVFKAHPDLSVAKANAKLKAEYKSNMRAVRMYELRELAKNGGALPAPPAQAEKRKPGRPPRVAGAPMASAGRSPGEEHHQALPMMIRLEGKNPAEAIASALEELRMAGLTNLAVSDRKDRYVVIDHA